MVIFLFPSFLSHLLIIILLLGRVNHSPLFIYLCIYLFNHVFIWTHEYVFSFLGYNLTLLLFILLLNLLQFGHWQLFQVGFCDSLMCPHLFRGLFWSLFLFKKTQAMSFLTRSCYLSAQNTQKVLTVLGISPRALHQDMNPWVLWPCSPPASIFPALLSLLSFSPSGFLPVPVTHGGLFFASPFSLYLGTLCPDITLADSLLFKPKVKEAFLDHAWKGRSLGRATEESLMRYIS